MSYNPNIPQVGDFTAISQKQILKNFQSIANSFLVDHVPLTAVKNQGLHNVLTLRPQSTDPTTGANQSAFYNKLVTSVAQLFFRSNNDGTVIQMSNSNLNTMQTGAPGSTQSTFTAGPFTIYMGYVLNCPNGQIVALTPSTNLIYVGLSTSLVSTSSVTVIPGLASTAVPINISGNQFTVRYNTVTIPVNPNIYYTAVGV